MEALYANVTISMSEFKKKSGGSIARGQKPAGGGAQP